MSPGNFHMGNIYIICIFIIITFFIMLLREGFKKKNCEKAVRLTAWVDPPLPSPEAVRKM